MKFKVNVGQLQIINNGLDKAKEVMGCKGSADALEHIAQSFLEPEISPGRLAGLGMDVAKQLWEKTFPGSVLNATPRNAIALGE
jgi:hypothetical protein